MTEADATVALTIRIPAFMVDALDTLVSASRPIAPTFRTPTRADLVRRALGEFLDTREPAAAPPAPAARPRVTTTTYPPRAPRRAVAR